MNWAPLYLGGAMGADPAPHLHMLCCNVRTDVSMHTTLTGVQETGRVGSLIKCQHHGRIGTACAQPVSGYGVRSLQGPHLRGGMRMTFPRRHPAESLQPWVGRRPTRSRMTDWRRCTG